MAKFKLKPWQPLESAEQEAVFTWARLHEHQHPQLKLLHSSLSGVKLNIGQAVKAKKAGMVQGIPDLFLPVPMFDEHDHPIFSGLYLELKRRQGGRLSEAQKWFIEQLRANGFRVEVPAGAPEAISIITEYLGIQP